jgi:uncharacterized protein YdaU (DUF1376 family)
MGHKTDLWMPIYWGDYLKDTMRLSTVEHGAYLLLIAEYWISGKPLPDDDHQLKSITKFSAYNWKKFRPIIEKYFTVQDGLWKHHRIDEELRKAAENQEKRSDKARKAADAPSMLGASPSPSPSQIEEDKQHQPCSISPPDPDKKPPVDDDHVPFAKPATAGLSNTPDYLDRSNETKPTDVIKVFDDLIIHHWGAERRRPWPNQMDHGTAKQWLENGADLDMIGAVLGAVMASMHGREKEPPGSLSYFSKSIAGAIKNALAPMPEADQNGFGRPQSVGVHQDSETNRWRGRVEGFKGKGFWMDSYGPTPDQPGCECPPNILKEFGYGLRLVRAGV